MRAHAEMNTIAKAARTQYPDSNRGQFASVITLGESDGRKCRHLLLMLLGWRRSPVSRLPA
jgi:hypothetical protein